MISVGSLVQLQPDPPSLWGCSSAGRAPALQAGGHRFDPGQLHHSGCRKQMMAGLYRAAVGRGSRGVKAQTREQPAVPDDGGAGFWFTALRQAANSIGSNSGIGNCLFFNNSEAVKSSGRLDQAAVHSHCNNTRKVPAQSCRGSAVGLSPGAC